MSSPGARFYANTIGLHPNFSGSQVAGNLCALLSCVIRDNSSDGVEVASQSVPFMLVLQDTIIWNNGGYGVNLPSSGILLAVNRGNAYGSNTSGARNNFSAGTGDVSLTADPNVSASTGNFALNNTSGGGAACKAAGFPGIALLGTGYADIGPLQSQASGGGAVFSPIGCGFIKGI